MVTNNVFVELFRQAYLQHDTTLCPSDKVAEVVENLCRALPPTDLDWKISITPTSTTYYDGED